MQKLWLLLLTTQQTLMPLLVRHAKTRTDVPLFIATTTVFMMEVIRISLCSIVLSYHYGSFLRFVQKCYKTIVGNPMETFKICVPAIIYAIQNNLYYIALANLDATLYSITYQLRILTTALLSIIILKKLISNLQWIALLLSMFGVIIVQYEQQKFNRNSNQLDSSSIDSITSAPNNRLIGFAAVIGMCFTSAFAGVYFEKVLKHSTVDLWMQNIRLSMMTLPFSCITMLLADYDQISQDGLFYGWDGLIWLITTASAFGGLLVSAVMKYADNVKKTYCQTVAIVGTAIGSVLLDDFDATPTAIIGMIIVLLSVYLYSAGGNSANKFAKMKSSIERA